MAVKYIFELIVCSGLFLVFYRWLLAGKVSFRICRAYIMITMALAVIIPILNVPLYPAGNDVETLLETFVIGVPGDEDETAATEVSVLTAEEGTAPEAAEYEQGKNMTSATWVKTIRTSALIIYILTALASLALIAHNAIIINSLKRRSKLTYEKEYTLAENKEIKTPFSFIRTIFMGYNYEPHERRQILTHEASHVRHRHSYERISLSVLRSLFWFNPFFWMAEKDLEEVQEWEADKDVLSEGHELKVYRTTIFKQLFGYNPDISCGLNNSMTKQRFIMMNRTLKGRGALLRLAATIPAIAAAFLAFGCGVKSPLPASEAQTNLTEDMTVEYVIPCLPLAGQGAYHDGIDYALNEGDAVWAAADGRIVDIHDGYRSLVEFRPAIIEVIKPFTPITKESGKNVYDCGNGTLLTTGYNVEGGDYFTSSVKGAGKGLNVTIEHADGSRTTYAHLSKILFRDPLVKAGDIIGYAGSTGDATGTHLHFEVTRDGKAVDPGQMKPIQLIELTVRGDKVYHDRMPLDLEKNDVEILARRFAEVNELPTIHIKTEGDVKVGTMTDIKDQLRKAGTRRLTVGNDGDVTVTKPLPPHQASITGLKVMSIEEVLKTVSRRDLIQIKINKDGKVLMIGNDGEHYISDADDLDIEVLQNMIINPQDKSDLPGKEFKELPKPDGSTVKMEISKAMVTLEPSEATDQNDYLVLQKRVRKAFTDIREAAAMEIYGRKMDELSKEEKRFIYMYIPITICEVAPKPEKS